MGLLRVVSAAAKRAARGANDRGVLSRARSIFRKAEDDLMAEPTRGFVNHRVYPERLWNASEPVHRTNYQPMLSYDPPIAHSDVGGPWQAIEEQLLREMSPAERARYLWSLE